MVDVRWAVLVAGRYQLAARDKQWRIQGIMRQDSLSECDDCRSAGTGLKLRCSDAISNGLNAEVQGLPVEVRLFPTLAPARLMEQPSDRE